jgi:Uma2 family endonuclease
MVATRPITIEEFETLPLEGRWELIDGEPVELTPSADESSSIGATIITLLGSFVRPRSLGRLYGADGGFVLFPDRPTVRVPDAAFVRAERAPQGQACRSFPRLAPDLVVEVLPRSDRASEVVAKLEMYQEAGVPLIWLVDPEQTTINVIASGKSTKVLQAGDTLDGGDVLPGFSVPVGEIFA